jgi:hypothetical protein
MDGEAGMAEWRLRDFLEIGSALRIVACVSTKAGFGDGDIDLARRLHRFVKRRVAAAEEGDSDDPSTPWSSTCFNRGANVRMYRI